MDIKGMVRKALLLEAKKRKLSYGCLMAFLRVKKNKWDALLDLIDDKDIYRPKTYGAEDYKSCHVTILYGLHEDIEDKDIEKVVKGFKVPKIKFTKISSFDKDEYDVIKFSVDSQDLRDMNKEMKKFPYTNDYPKYNPNSTICYVKAGKAKEYLKLLNDYIKENPLEVEFDKIVYSKADDSEKSYK